MTRQMKSFIIYWMTRVESPAKSKNCMPIGLHRLINSTTQQVPHDQWIRSLTSIQSRTIKVSKRSLQKLRSVLISDKSRTRCQHFALYSPFSSQPADSIFIMRSRNTNGAAIPSAHADIRRLYVWFPQFLPSSLMLRL